MATPDSITIVPFRPEFASAFSELNRAWIERLFALEPADWKLLQDPKTAILDPGGQIFFALDGAVVVGTVAAVRESPTSFELAKMAVAPTHQGRGLGLRLGQAVVDFARVSGAELLFLLTNSRLGNAIRLYERLGFRHAPPPSHSEYVRADVYMELRFGRHEG